LHGKLLPTSVLAGTILNAALASWDDRGLPPMLLRSNPAYSYAPPYSHPIHFGLHQPHMQQVNAARFKSHLQCFVNGEVQNRWLGVEYIY
jgi:hypothetical protein